MRQSDVIVIGAGLAGLTAAAAAVRSGKSVTVLAKGAGTVAFGGGVIDLLGYVDGEPVTNPLEGVRRLPEGHPYVMAGTNNVIEAVAFFQDLCKTAEYPLTGSSNANTWVPTAAGTLKPSCLVPYTMNTDNLKQAEHICVIGFAGLKDFFPSIVVKGLKQMTGYTDNCEAIVVEHTIQGDRDVTALDLARWMETPEGEVQFTKQVRDRISEGACLLMPPVLGSEPDYRLWRRLEETLKCRIIELAAAPPAITGSRLRKMLVKYLKSQGVKIIEQANVRRYEATHGRITAVATKHFGREQIYKAGAFIIASGGFLGGGLVAEPSRVFEPIFNLPVYQPKDEPSMRLFDQAGQPFARTGVRVNNRMQPIDEAGQVVWDNLFATGNVLADYDYCLEKSGNGVALVTAYIAAQNAVKEGQS